MVLLQCFLFFNEVNWSKFDVGITYKIFLDCCLRENNIRTTQIKFSRAFLRAKEVGEKRGKVLYIKHRAYQNYSNDIMKILRHFILSLLYVIQKIVSVRNVRKRITEPMHSVTRFLPPLFMSDGKAGKVPGIASNGN